MDASKRRVGFRLIELFNKVGGIGTSYQYYKVNNVPVFIKGANWIPADSFESRVNHTVLSNLLHSAAAAHMNMLRVWGGGLYQKDAFYDLADELGLMLWQEFIFSDSTYPVDKPFLDNVAQEVLTQVRRLSHHPCIATWSGNNEINPLPWYKGHVQDWYTLYIDTVFDNVVKEDKSRPIRPTCPSNGFKTGVYKNGLPDGKPLTLVDQSDPGPGGERHYYNFTLCRTMEKCGFCTDISEYPITDFASEFGWMSAASLETMRPYLGEPSEDYNLLSAAMEDHQNWLFYNKQLYNQVLFNFNTYPAHPNATNEKTFRRMIYLSQIVQAQCIRQEVEYYRRGRETFRHTMGSMYWMLNDIWPAPTWSSIEYGGRWKVLHHMATRFYEPVHPSLWENGTHVGAHVANDLQQPWKGSWTLTVQKYATGSKVVVGSGTIVVDALSGMFVFNGSIPSLLKKGGCSSTVDCFVHWELQESDSSNDPLVALLWLSSLKKVTLPKAHITTTVAAEKDTSGAATITVESSTVALYVTFTTSIRGRFSDNVLFLTPGEKVVIKFLPWEEYTTKQLVDTLVAQAMNEQDTYTYELV
eukprot:TRINITY_DN21305_c0_g1_i1.p1 TRINITY_DN21305_c0_g1~~TRINITY_DN21305_c0_g1_i1.p1  ORF type:complete len:645 (+),score=86.72 TRINITY_DN21305_c0_g1_i1:188-1936(+)